MTVNLRILSADDTGALEQVRQFFRNYAAWLGVDLCFQGFDQEMAHLPGAYAAPEGRLFLAELDGLPVGCVGLRPLPGTEGACEMKRLYVEPEFRNRGIGAEMVRAVIRSAKVIGYRHLMLDTLPNMRIAVKLYRDLGFKEAPAYYQTPVEGTMFLALDLENWSEDGKHNPELSHLFDFNRAWAQRMQEVDPGYFDKLSKLQSPEYLWIGCSDSRVPANQIVGLLPGEVFVHRNVANLVLHTDLNCVSVIQYAVDVLRVKHIMVVGHYGCGGVAAALNRARVGVVDFWLHTVQQIHNKYRRMIDPLPLRDQHDRLCELNILEQVVNLGHTPVVQDAWARGQPLTLHGWIFGLRDGLVNDLGITADSEESLHDRHRSAIEALRQRIVT